MDLVEEDILMHYGVKRRSGRYPWGSGDNPYQHGGDFLARVEELQRLGKTEKQIADELHLSTTDLRMQSQSMNAVLFRQTVPVLCGKTVRRWMRSPQSSVMRMTLLFAHC